MLSDRSPRRATVANIGTRRFLGAMIALVCVAIVGCSQGDRPPLGTVKGVVTLDGQPLPNAAVRFLPVVPVRASMSMTDADGRYELVYIRDIMGAAVGDHRVEITTAAADTQEKLPTRYHAQTTLTAKVEPGVNEINFDLTSDTPKP
jgi:hypothetical protein